MKKVFNYRNISDIKCKVDKFPIGFKYSDYPEINTKLANLRENPIDLSKKFSINDHWDDGDCVINIDFNKQKINLEVNGSDKTKNYILNAYQWYYHIIDKSLITSRSIEYSDLFKTDGCPWSTSKRMLVPITVKKLGHSIDIDNITSMEVVGSWWGSSIKVTLHFSRSYIGIENITFTFSKDDKNDVDFFVKEINTIKRMIESKEQEKLFERWETIE